MWRQKPDQGCSFLKESSDGENGSKIPKWWIRSFIAKIFTDPWTHLSDIWDKASIRGFAGTVKVSMFSPLKQIKKLLRWNTNFENMFYPTSQRLKRKAQLFYNALPTLHRIQNTSSVSDYQDQMLKMLLNVKGCLSHTVASLLFGFEQCQHVFQMSSHWVHLLKIPFLHLI